MARDEYEDEDAVISDEEQEPAFDPDLEDDVDEDAGGAADRNKATKRGKRRTSMIDDAAEEDEDGDRYRKKYRKASQFFDEEADVDEDDDEGDDVEEDYDAALIDDTGEDLGAEPNYAYHRTAADLDRAQESERTAEEWEAYLKDRYHDSNRYDGGGEEQAGTVGQQGLQPTPQDPKLWLVECLPGQEREAAICLLNKCRNLAAKGTPLLIKSAFCQDHLRGYLYIEAHREAHVREAISGLRVIRGGKGANLVPLREMVESITVNKQAKQPLEIGAWVRVKSGPYKGDLAKIVSFDGQGKLGIKLVPRLDYQALSSREARLPFGQSRTKVRPAPRAFNPSEAMQHQGIKVTQTAGSELGGTEYRINSGTARFHQGYLFKYVMPTGVQPEDSIPPLDEIQRYNAVASASTRQDDQGGGDDLQALVQSLPEEYMSSTRGFVKGDRVRVTSGDLAGLTGRIHAVGEDGRMDVMPDLDELREVLTFEAKQLSKFFQSGDHVRITFGPGQNQTGLVVRVEGPVCVVFTDSTQQNIECFSKDLTEAAAAESAGLETFGEYELHDLVQLDGSLVGVVVGVDQDSCRVLTSHLQGGKPDIRVCRAPDIKRKIDGRSIKFNVTQDASGNPIHEADMVNIPDGPGGLIKSGTVKYVMHGCVFVYNREWAAENSGFLAVKGRACRVRGGTAAMAPMGGMGMGGATPFRGGAPNVFSNNVFRSPAPHQAQQQQQMMMGGPMGGRGMGQQFGGPPGGGGGRGFSGRANTRADNSMVGRMLSVKKGQHRGYRGRVLSATETHVRLELEANYKTVTVKKEALDLGEMGGGMPGGLQRAGDRYGAPGGPARGGYGAPPTPSHLAGGRTPMHTGSATPHHAWGSATPMHPGSATPHWQPNQTPGRDSAWGSATPMHPSGEGGDEPGYGYGAASTPGYPSAETPAMTPGLDAGYGMAATPGNADTPGMDHRYGGAPTPGAAPTPYAAAPTPGTVYAAAPTPGGAIGYSPAVPTPGMAPTPGSLPLQTPGSAYGATPGMAPTPGMVVMSPAVPGGGDGPGMGGAAVDVTMWVGLQVECLKDGRAGVVRSAGQDGASVEVEFGQRSDGPSGRELVLGAGSPIETLPMPEVRLIQPERKDRVRVVAGESTGVQGSVISVEHPECIVKMDGSGGVKIFELSLVGVVHGGA